MPVEPTRPGWRWHRLLTLARLATGHTPSRRCPEYWNGDIPWLQLPDIRALDGQRALDTLEHTNELGIKNSAAVLLPEGTVCLSRTASVGFVTVMGRPMATSQDFVNWVCGPDLSPEFLKWLFIACRKPIRDLGSGAVHQTIYCPTVEQFAVCIPPLAEQERIAGRLTEQLGAVERARAAAAQRLAAAESLPAALLREVFGDPPPFDASPLAPSTPTKPGWKWHRLTSLARLATGHTPSRRCPEYWNGDIPWIQLPDIRALDGRVAMDTSEHTNALGIENSAAVRLPAGSVCLSRTASVGFVTIMGREMATSQDFVNWVCGPDLDPSFLMHLFIACRKPIRDLGSGAVHHTIYFPTVEQFSVCVPDLPTQRRLAAEITQRLAAAEGVIVRCRDELAAIEALPAALLRDAFGGAEARE
ncbi:MAG: restriction endonuclease subunit S [Planctomycetes bacterium]|nr:restriction endonuclease subunit S [Planctomycetota bacterium]